MNRLAFTFIIFNCTQAMQKLKKIDTNWLYTLLKAAEIRKIKFFNFFWKMAKKKGVLEPFLKTSPWIQFLWYGYKNSYSLPKLRFIYEKKNFFWKKLFLPQTVSDIAFDLRILGVSFSIEKMVRANFPVWTPTPGITIPGVFFSHKNII